MKVKFYSLINRKHGENLKKDIKAYSSCTIECNLSAFVI
jgi:hypothetical protein